MVLIKQHVSAYCEAIIRFTMFSYRKLTFARDSAHRLPGSHRTYSGHSEPRPTMYFSVIVGFNKVRNLFWSKGSVQNLGSSCLVYTLYSKFMSVSERNVKIFPFPVPLVLCVPRDHVRDCCIYGNNFRAFSAVERGAEWDEARTNCCGSVIRKGPGARICCFRRYHYL